MIKNIKLAGSKGVINDPTLYNTPDDSWTEALNVQFQGGYVKSAKGFIPSIDLLTDAQAQAVGLDQNNVVRDAALSITYSGDKVGASILYLTDTKVYEDGPNGLADISGTQDDGTGQIVATEFQADVDHQWRYSKFGNNAVIVNSVDDPQYRSVNGGDIQPLPGWATVTGAQDLVWKTPRMVSYKNVLVCLGMFEGDSVSGTTTYYPQRIRWSDFPDTSQAYGVPSDWDDSSLDNSAGYVDLFESNGVLKEALQLRDSLYVYSDEDTYRMDYIGGNDIFSFRKVFDDLGAITDRAVVQFENKHFVVTKNDIRIHDGASHKSIATNRVKDQIFREISDGKSTDYVRAITHTKEREVWVLYKSNYSTTQEETSGGAFNRAAIWNWEFDTWTFRWLPNLYTLGEYPEVDAINNANLWQNYNDASGTPPNDSWIGANLQTLHWQDVSSLGTTKELKGFSQMGCVVRLGGNNSQLYSRLGGTNRLVLFQMPMYMYRYNIDFDQEGMPLFGFKKVKNIYPQFEGTGICRLSVGVSDSPKISTVNKLQRFDFDIEKDYKADFRTNSRYFSIFFDFAGDVTFRLSDYDIEYEVGGLK